MSSQSNGISKACPDYDACIHLFYINICDCIQIFCFIKSPLCVLFTLADALIKTFHRKSVRICWLEIADFVAAFISFNSLRMKAIYKMSFQSSGISDEQFCSVIFNHFSYFNQYSNASKFESNVSNCSNWNEVFIYEYSISIISGIRSAISHDRYIHANNTTSDSN